MNDELNNPGGDGGQVRQEAKRTGVLGRDSVSRETLSEKTARLVKKEQNKQIKELAKKAELDAVRKKGGITDDNPYDFDNPTLKELYSDFRKNNLSRIESGYNALYLWCYDNYYSSGVPVKSKYKNIHAHPLAWFNNAHHMWRHNKWSVIVKLLEIVPKLEKLRSDAVIKHENAKDSFWKTMEYSHRSAKSAVGLMSTIVCLAAIAGVGIWFADTVKDSLYGEEPALMLYIDGNYVGDVLSITDTQNAKDNAEATISTNLGTAYSLDCDISYKATTIQKGSHKNIASIERAFKEKAHEQMKNGYGLYVYDVLVAVSESRAWLEDSMNESLSHRLSAKQKSDSSIERLYFNNFVIRDGSYPDKYFCTLEEIRQMFSLPDSSAQAQATGASDDMSNYLNVTNKAPVLAGGSAGMISDVEVSSGENEDKQHLIPIETVITRTVTRVESIPYGTDYIYDETLAENKSSVSKAGRNGSKTVVYLAEYVGEKEISKRAISENVSREPINQVVIQGTRPLTDEERRVMSTGTYIYPSSGSLSSGYSWRKWGSYNEFHKGIDIVDDRPEDRNIVASDGGTVTQARDRGDGYGRCILITHDDGTITKYAHCQTLLVKEGQKVAQGEQIAIMGRTGNSTGIHVHFEIIKNGSVVNPMEYLPPR